MDTQKQPDNKKYLTERQIINQVAIKRLVILAVIRREIEKKLTAAR